MTYKLAVGSFNTSRREIARDTQAQEATIIPKGSFNTSGREIARETQAQGAINIAREKDIQDFSVVMTSNKTHL